MPWRDITSQPLVRHLLQRSLEHGRTHHGYLFMGETGETEPMAMGFAQALNCEKNDGDFCGVCSSCKWIAENKHPDVHHLKPESRSRRILISQIRQSERSLHLKANRARIKLGIIHFADRLQAESQDAFLKTLEEPPANTVFLLLTEEPQQLKDTILSRCLRVPFRPGPKKEKSTQDQQVEEWLTQLHSSSTSESPIVHAYGFTGKVLGILKKVRDEKTEQADGVMDDPSYDNLDASQKKILEEQLAAQAQAEYLHERGKVLRVMQEWYHSNHPHSKGVEIVENLSRHLARNINESLAWEVAMLQLAKPMESNRRP